MVELNLELEEMDIKTTFLYGHLDEIIYFKRIEWISDRKQWGLCLQNKHILL